MIAAGSRLGPYEILSALGVGRGWARSIGRRTRGSGDVAIKVLPASFSADADRLRRFERGQSLPLHAPGRRGTREDHGSNGESGRESDPSDEVLKSRIGPQGIDCSLDSQIDEPARPLLIRLLQQLEGLVFLSEPHIDAGD